VDRSAIARIIVDEWIEVQSLTSSSTSGSKCNRSHHRRRVDRTASPIRIPSSINSKLCHCIFAINQSIPTNFPIATYQYFSIDSKVCNRLYRRRQVDLSASHNCTRSYRNLFHR
jgi:hypothetical protein